ncbi:MAG: sulfatase modifying factor 1 [Planctomycetota bacterium]|jgi:sulfatase modifying factor 1
MSTSRSLSRLLLACLLVCLATPGLVSANRVPQPTLSVFCGTAVTQDEVAATHIDPRWTGSGRGARPERRALIIAVDQNEGGAALGFPAAGKGARELGKALNGLGFADVRIVAGEKASRPGVRRALKDLTGDLRGEGHKALVVWIGHGFVRSGDQSEQQLLTFYSGLSGDNDVFTNTLSSTELSEMLRGIRRPGVELGFILEACRTPIAGAPSKPPTKLKPAAEVECRTASGLHPALVPENLGMPLFTHHFIKALGNSASSRISLLGALRAAVAGTEQNSRQGPEITTGAADMLLVDRSNLTVTIQPLASNSSSPLPNTEIWFQGRKGQRNPVTGAMTFSGLSEGATYELRLKSDGHWTSEHYIDAEAENDGRTFEVFLNPRYIDIEGKVLSEANETVRVSLTGDFSNRALSGYHILKATPDAEGKFSLRVPASSNVHSLLVRSGSKVVSRVSIDLSSGLNSKSPIRIPIEALQTTAYANRIAAIDEARRKDATDRTGNGAEPSRPSRQNSSSGAGGNVPSGWVNAGTEQGEAGWATRVQDPKSGIVFRLIPSGTFLMGSPSSEYGRYDDETQHWVAITQPFYMAETETTQEQWHKVMGTNPSNFPGNDRPVENVSWTEAIEFCKQIGGALPTESQWEYACRAGTTTPFTFGSSISTSQANYDGNYAYGSGGKGSYRKQTTSVGSFNANAWGLFDMHGNVLEWCSDGYGDYPGGSQSSPVRDPKGSNSVSSRVLRGGSWNYGPGYLRAADRASLDPGGRLTGIGFRVSRIP